MKKYRRQLVLTGALVVIACLFAATILHANKLFLVGRGSGPRTFTVTLTDLGFQPSSLTIRQGDTVHFISAWNVPFWPASDPHPTHSLYPAFDPKHPIAPNDSWSFTFDRIGSWGYHDHLAPALTGTIVVDGIDGKTGQDSQCTQNPHNLNCWREILLSITDSQGPKAALIKLSEMFKVEPGFSLECHTLTHDIGVASWQWYIKDPTSILTPDAAACGDGFYHGFMEAFLTTTRDPQKAKAFCTFIGEKIGAQSPDAELQCYHGIGHGAMDFAIGQLAFSSATTTLTAETLINPAIALCRSVSTTGDEMYRCGSAVFNSLANLYLATTTRQEFNLTLDSNDPLWICRQYPDLEDSCNGNMNVLIYSLAGREFSKAVQYVEAIGDDTLAQSAMSYLAALSADGESRDNPQGAVIVCRSVQERLHLSCIDGLAHGFLENGQPGQQGNEALAFCALPILSSVERNSCYNYVLSTLLGWFSPEESQELCQSAPASYQKYCPASLKN